MSAENDRSHQSGMVVGVCVWCRSKYVVGCSRAHEQHIFCSKKCEIEGRFWLMELLRAIPRPRRNPEDIRGFGI